MYIKKTVLLPIIAILIISCSKSGTGTPGTQTSSPGLIPLSAGNTWIYKKTNFDTSGNGNVQNITGDTIIILSEISVDNIAYYQQVQASVTNINGGSFFVNIDSNTVEKIDSATTYTFFKRVSADGLLVDSWADTVHTRCIGQNELYGYTGTTTVNGHDCLKNIVLVNDCTSANFEKWVYYLQPGLGLVRIENYALDTGGSFYLKFSDDLLSYSLH